MVVAFLPGFKQMLQKLKTETDQNSFGSVSFLNHRFRGWHSTTFDCVKTNFRIFIILFIFFNLEVTQGPGKQVEGTHVQKAKRREPNQFSLNKIRCSTTLLGKKKRKGTNRILNSRFQLWHCSGNFIEQFVGRLRFFDSFIHPFQPPNATSTP